MLHNKQTTDASTVIALPKMIAPPALSFEIVIARKIKSLKLPLLRIWMRIDEDDDGKVSKSDLKNALRGIFEMELSEHQIDHIFNRSAYFAPKQVQESRDSDDSTESLNFEKMGFREFVSYIEETANTRSSSSSVNFGSSDITSSPQRIARGKIVDRKSLTAKTKELKEIVYKHIQQRVPLDVSETGINFSFLQMDTLRNNEITGKEFQDWLKIKNGLNFSDEEMKLIRGDWRKDEGLSYQEFDYFVNCLPSESGKGNDNKNMVRKLSVNHGSQKVGGDGNSKTDVELIWELMNYFRGHRTLIEAFEVLDVSNSKGLSAQDIQRGLEVAGVSISLDRAKLLTHNYVSLGGRMTKPGFVRLMTSAPKVTE